MTQLEANQEMLECFEKLLGKAKNTEDVTELTVLTDSVHKLYITLSNAGVFVNSAPLTNHGFIN